MAGTTFWPREKIEKAEAEAEAKTTTEPGDIYMPEESEESIQARLQRSQDQISLILMILHYRNYTTDEEKLRQIRVVVE